jgi:hypothetical protein
LEVSDEDEVLAAALEEVGEAAIVDDWAINDVVTDDISRYDPV